MDNQLRIQDEFCELEGHPVCESFKLTRPDQKDEMKTNWDKLEFHGSQSLLFLHMSDTHNMHGEIENRFPLPDCDLDFLLHTGDMTDHGSLEEFRSVNEYFGRIKCRFKHGIIVIAGNHDVHGNRGEINLKEILTNATVLHHEISHEVFEACGLKIFGSPWCAWKPASNPGGDGHLFDSIPDGVDILMTHGPPSKIFDTVGYRKNGISHQCFHWGSSKDLNAAILRARPRVHLFGHLHEQRGVWQRDMSGHFVGGVEYQAKQGQPFPTTGPPPQDWPCDLVSCNAMCNHAGHEGTQFAHIAGPPRLIVATRISPSEPWTFDALKAR
jgi:predicted phosphodiesterase